MIARLHEDEAVSDLPRRVIADEQGFTRTHVGTRCAILLRIHEDHVALACKAVAERLGVPVGAITVDWEAVKAKRPVKLRRAA